MSSPEESPNVVVYEPGRGPSLVDSPPGSSSTESHVSFDVSNLPPDEQCMDYSSVYPGDWRQEDADGLRELGWSQRPMRDHVPWQSYVPYWSKPGWDPNIETTMDGSMQRAIRGDAGNFMRPMILPRDSDVPRTDYTKRWGINQGMPKTSNDEWRSGLTPTAAAADPGAERQWTHEESWQSYWFEGFTTQELIDIGAYTPSAKLPEPNLPAASLNPLFKRDRWRQLTADAGLGGASKKVRNLNMKYSLDGITDNYDAEFNDDLWDALQPSLRLASNVINSQHPTWLMFLRGLYHMRKVPMEKDGRTDREKIQVNYRPYRSLWHDVDENQMYDNARRLWYLGFDFGRATAGVLNNSLRWSFYEIQPPNNGSTFTNPDGSIYILLNANTVWPLLVDGYPESEKVAARVKLAMTMLHELVHACHQAHHLMMEDPRHFLSSIPDMQLTDEIVTHLLELRFEAIGEGQRGDNGRQYFIENEVSMEEGKSLDNRLWGSITVYFPPLSTSSFRPMIMARDWPFTHPEVYHQNAEAVRAGGYGQFTIEPYRTFLLFPRTPVYELCTPIPVSNYFPLMQSSWWDNDFQKYGHPALNISSTRTGQSYPLQSSLNSRYNNFKSVLMPLAGNKSVVRFLMTTAPNILQRQNQRLISAWLSQVSLEMAGSKIMRLRLHYERKTWDDKYGAIRNSCQKIIQDFAAASNSLQNYLSNADDGSGVVDLYQVMSQLHTLFRQDLLELHRLVDYESRYSQCVTAEYFLKDLDDRWLVRRSMHVLLGHLQATCGQVGGILQAMMEIWKGMGADAVFAEQVQECETLYSRINTAQTAIFSVVQVLRGNTLGERSGPGGHGPLAAVPVALRELRNGRNLRVAAMREYARIGDPKLRRLIQTWLNIIHFSQDIRHDDPDADDVVVGGGTIAELRRARDQAAGDALAISYLDRQDQVEANRAQGIEPAEGEDLVAAELQDEMAQLELSSEIVDLYSHSFSEEEQDRLRRRSF